MKNQLFILLLLIVFSTSGCYLPISGRVVDAETNAPIEGAVVLVEWTKTKGFGFTYTESVKVVETLSDKEGRFDLPGCYSFSVNAPDLTIYKKAYIAWNNKLIFPSNEKRKDFRWSSGPVFSLERFNENYSHNQHVRFIRTGINSTLASDKKKVIEGFFDWEVDLAREELKRK